MMDEPVDKLLVCPYNRSHLIYASRLAIHVVKCANSRSTKKNVTCTFNPAHRVSPADYHSHLILCPSLSAAEPTEDDDQEASANVTKLDDANLPAPLENWDEAVQNSGTYEPDKISQTKAVMRIPQGMTKSQRRVHREHERKRFRDLMYGPLPERTNKPLEKRSKSNTRSLKSDYKPSNSSSRLNSTSSNFKLDSDFQNSCSKLEKKPPITPRFTSNSLSSTNIQNKFSKLKLSLDSNPQIESETEEEDFILIEDDQLQTTELSWRDADLGCCNEETRDESEPETALQPSVVNSREYEAAAVTSTPGDSLRVVEPTKITASADSFMDEDPLLPCPYNRSHQVYQSRLPIHLSKCRKRNEASRPICPLDATHHVQAPDLITHIKTCPNRGVIERDRYLSEIELQDVDTCRQLTKCQEIVLPPIKENWDDESFDGTYEASKSVADKELMLSPQGKTKSERKAHLMRERGRIKENDFL